MNNNTINNIVNFINNYKNTAMYTLVSLFFVIGYIGTIGEVSMVSASFQTNVLSLILLVNTIFAIRIYKIERSAIKNDKKLENESYFNEVVEELS